MSASDTLRLEAVDVCYGDLQVLWSVDLRVGQGEVVAIMGSNGAGKSTVMNTISGLTKVTRGRILFEEQDITGLPTAARVSLGIAHVLERHRLFPLMSVRENLLLGAYSPKARARTQDALDRVFTLFPFLQDRQKQLAGSFSGGEQQMLAIARGLMSHPRLIMLDEPFLGLSPAMVRGIIAIVAKLKASGLTVLFIEQHVRHSLTMSDRAEILEAGRVVLSGRSADLLQDDRVQRVYMGLETAEPVPVQVTEP